MWLFESATATWFKNQGTHCNTLQQTENIAMNWNVYMYISIWMVHSSAIIWCTLLSLCEFCLHKQKLPFQSPDSTFRSNLRVRIIRLRCATPHGTYMCDYSRQPPKHNFQIKGLTAIHCNILQHTLQHTLQQTVMCRCKSLYQDQGKCQETAQHHER